MTQVGRKLNLKSMLLASTVFCYSSIHIYYILEHKVGKTELSVCGDLEVHKVKDKFYAIDAGL